MLSQAPILFYTRSHSEFPSGKYELYQENGTKYVRSLEPAPESLLQRLNANEGEIYLYGLPDPLPAEHIIELAALVGQVHKLRIKVNFLGQSRGFAYLQYRDPALMPIAIQQLPQIFLQHGLPMIGVRESRNDSKLLLKKVHRKTPEQVFEKLCQIVVFKKLVCYEIHSRYFWYQIVFSSNEDAVFGRRAVLRSIGWFGAQATILWANLGEHENAPFFELWPPAPIYNRAIMPEQLPPPVHDQVVPVLPVQYFSVYMRPITLEMWRHFSYELQEELLSKLPPGTPLIEVTSLVEILPPQGCVFIPSQPWRFYGRPPRRMVPGGQFSYADYYRLHMNPPHDSNNV